MKKIVLTGGGTVGHVTLNLLLIPRFVEEGWEVHYIGDKKGVEYQEISQLDAPVVFHGIATGKLRRYFSLQNMLDVFKVAFGILQSLLILLRVRPQALFSKGGFVSVPPVVAARVLGIPVFIHESDMSMGLANKIAYKCATKMYTTFEQSHQLTKAKHVGAVTKVGAANAEHTADISDVTDLFDAVKPTLLFVGGSAGAKVFNEFVSRFAEKLTERYNVINITGDSQLDNKAPGLFRMAYATDKYLPLLELADVVVTRGGSNTLFELLALQKLHIIVPLGKEASRGDQLENARYFREKGYALTIPEDQLTEEALEESIAELLTQKVVYQERMAASKDIQTPEVFYQMLVADMVGKESHD